jgi:hypothetical protein
MQILDEAVELPQDSTSVPSPRSAYPTRMTSETLPNHEFVVKPKVAIVAGKAECWVCARQNILVGDWRTHPYEPGLNDL